MFNLIAQRIKKNLMQELHGLSAADLEDIGHYMIIQIEGKELVHHGTNMDKRPVGYTVDSFSEDAVIVAEYSTEKDYFQDYSEKEGYYKKIHKDIEHAITHSNGKLCRIYLVTTQEEVPSFRQKFNKTCDMSDKYEVRFYDARRIAETVYQQSLDSSIHAEFYKQFLPNYSQELDNYEYYGKIPPLCEKFCDDSNALEQIEKHFKIISSVCLLYGISGSGKTQIANQYVRINSNRFQNYIWISGDDWKQGTTLSAVQRTRGGSPVNVAGLFNKYKTILVIDGLERQISLEDLSELKVGMDKGGKILITSQLNSQREFCMQMPELEESTAYNILGESDVDNDDAKKIILRCKGIPLVLSILRRIADHENVPRKILYREVLDTPKALTGEDGTSILKKILSRLSCDNQRALVKISNTGVAVFDIDFLRWYCGALHCHALQQLSILMITNVPGIVKVHDLICSALQEQDEPIKVLNSMQQYVAKENGEMTASVIRQSYIFRDLIVKYKKKYQECDWLLYLLLQIEGNERKKIINKIYRKKISPHMKLPEIMCLIEAKEQWCYQINGEENQRNYLNILIKELDSASKMFGKEMQTDVLLHHLGKAYRRAQLYEQAYNCFQCLLDNGSSRKYAIYGQIATMGSSQKGARYRKKGEECMQELLISMLKDDTSIPLRIELATISRMRSYRKITFEIIDSEDKVKKVCQLVASAALEDMGQFFEGFVAVSSVFGYKYSNACVALAESVPDIVFLAPTEVDKLQWLNACEALANVAVAAKKNSKQELFKRLIQKGVDFCEAILALGKDINNYKARAIAKTCIISGNGAEALKVIRLVDDEKRDHWLLYRQAEAENMQEIKTAVQTAKRALELLDKDEKNKDRKASYLHLLSKCYLTNNKMNEAKAAVDQAIDCCDNRQYQEELRAYKMTLD